MDAGTRILLFCTVLTTCAWIVAAQRRVARRLVAAYLRLTHLERVLVVVAVTVCAVHAQKTVRSGGETTDFTDLHGVEAGVSTNFCESTQISIRANPWTEFQQAGKKLRASLAPHTSVLSDSNLSLPSVTNLCFWGIEKETNSVTLGLAWPDGLFLPNGCLDVFGHWELAPIGWTRLVQVDVSGAQSPVAVEIGIDSFPTNAMERMAFFRLATQDDTDGDGLTDAYEVWSLGTDPYSSDSDGDLIDDGEEIERGMNPNSDDSDGDGLSDMEELCMYETDPLSSDTDGDGLPDAWEISHGLDPLNAEGLDGVDGDPYFEGVTNGERYQYLAAFSSRASSEESVDYVSEGARLVTVVGDLAAGVEKTTNSIVTIQKGTKVFVGVFLHSHEYPTYTHQASQYNDVLSWRVSASGHATLNGSTQVNDEDGSWSAADANGQFVGSWRPVVFEDGGIFTAPAGRDLQVNVALSAKNVADGALPSTVIVGFFPLENLQPDWPVGTGFGRVADSGATLRKRLPEDGIGYVKAALTSPTITSAFAGLPDWIEVTWAATLLKERSERPTSDNRTVPATALLGDEAFNLYERIGDTLGGSVVLSFTVGGRFSGTTRYKVRGKNPRDSVARAYIDANVPSETRDYAWKIAVHESRQGARIYNQFNTGARLELPNKGSGFGWGIAQVDNHSGANDLTPFPQVWNWHENITAMSNKLAYALGRARAFIGYYREAYGTRPNWTEPPATNILGVSVSPEMWCVATIYNGVGGIPSQTAGRHSGFYSPLEFKPSTGRWVFHTNTTNPHYVRLVIGAGFIAAVE